MHHRIDIAHPGADQYRLRILGGMAFSMLVMVLLFRFWPIAEDPVSDQIFDPRGKEVISLEMIEPTRQIAKPPPPPAPAPPVEVPDDVILEEIELDIDSEISLDVGEEIAEEAQGPVDAGPALVVRADESPRSVRFVEPAYSKEANKNKVRAQVTIEVLVDTKGRVQESRIVDRFLLKKNGELLNPVDTIGYGIEEAALDAASKWQFRPARHNGRKVSSYTLLTFKFGISK